MQYSGEQLKRQVMIKTEFGLSVVNLGLFTVAFYTKNYPAMVLAGSGASAGIVDIIRHLWRGAYDADRFTKPKGSGPINRGITVVTKEKTGTLDDIRGSGGGNLKDHENDPTNR